MEFSFNRNKEELMNVIKSKADKKGLSVMTFNGKVEVSLDYNKYESIIPVSFKGKLENQENKSVLKGKFVYGFYLYTLVIIAALLIVARFVASLAQNQTGNMVLCGIVTVLLIIVIIVVHIKSKPAKNMIKEFLNDLNKK